MGLTEPKIYFDSCIAIYLVEEHPVFAPSIEALLETRPDAEVFISDLTVMECLVGPFRSGNRRLEDKFKRWFESILILPITNIIFTEAAQLRAKNPSLKTPDAIHLATAINNGCDEFWTNDERLSISGMDMVRNIVSD